MNETAEPTQELWAAAEQLMHQIDQDPVLAKWVVDGHLPPPVQLMENGQHTQKYWSAKVHQQVKHDLQANANLRDQIRLQSAGAEHAGAWLSVIPNENLGFHFGVDVYKLLIKSLLGMQVLPEAAAGTPCDDCGQPLDIYGDHLLSCRYGGAWKRHNFVAATLNAIAVSAGITTSREVQINGKERPADLLLSRWDGNRDAAVDLTIRHNLLPTAQWDLNQSAVAQAEEAKLTKYKDTCNAASVTFIPVGVDTFGATGPHAASFLGKLFTRYAKRAGRAEERYRGQHHRQRLSVALHKAKAEQLCAVFTVLGGVTAVPYNN